MKIRSSLPSVGIVILYSRGAPPPRLSPRAVALGRIQNRASPNDNESNPQADESGDDLADDVHGCSEELPIAEQLHALERERGKRRKAAEHADKEEHARVRSEHEAPLGQAGDDAEDHAADDVDREGADAEQRARRAEDSARKQIARNRSERAAN